MADSDLQQSVRSGESETHTPMRCAPAKLRKTQWIAPLVSIVAIGIVVGVVGANSTASTATTTQITRDVQAAMTTMTETVSTSGTIEPTQQADLSFSSSGTIVSVDVAVGDQVTAGQGLASIDTTELQSSVDTAQAAVDAAQSDYDTAVDSGVDAKITAAKSALATKQDALTNAQTALAAGTLTAPFDGTVAVVSIAVGDSTGSSSGGSGDSLAGGMGGSSSSGSSTTAISVISTGMYSVSASVDSTDVAKITKGMEASVTANGGTQALKGTVTSVGVIASSSSSSGASFPVTIDIADKQDGLYAGVSATVTITTSSREVLAVPTAAITQSPDGSTVELKNADGTTTSTKVETGSVSDSMTEITSGLKESDTVVVTMQTGGNATQNDPSALSTLFGTNGRGTGTRPSGFPTGGSFTGVDGKEGEFPRIEGGEMPNFGNGQVPDFSGGTVEGK